MHTNRYITYMKAENFPRTRNHSIKNHKAAGKLIQIYFFCYNQEKKQASFFWLFVISLLDWECIFGSSFFKKITKISNSDNFFLTSLIFSITITEDHHHEYYIHVLIDGLIFLFFNIFTSIFLEKNFLIL